MRSPIKYSIFVILLFLRLTLSFASAGENFAVSVRNDLNELFNAQTGFLGGDGFYAVPLGAGRTLVLFGDTIAGKIEGGKRKASKMANNSIAVMSGFSDFPESARVEFFLSDDLFPFFRPLGKDLYFWPLGGTMAGGRLYLFAALIERTAENDAFGFREAGNYLFTVENPFEAPAKWKVSRSEVAPARFRKGSYLLFGSSVLSHEGFVYVYGVKCAGAKKSLVLARVAPGSIGDFGAWEFYGAGGFARGGDPLPLLAGVANEFSVTYDGDARKFRLIYTLDGMNSKIVMRSSDTPIFGPKNIRKTIYDCPEHGVTKNVFTYSAKAVGPLCGPGSLVVVYFSNSFDFWEPFNNPAIYRPKFVEIKTKTPVEERF